MNNLHAIFRAMEKLVEEVRPEVQRTIGCYAQYSNQTCRRRSGAAFTCTDLNHDRNIQRHVPQRQIDGGSAFRDVGRHPNCK